MKRGRVQLKRKPKAAEVKKHGFRHRLKKHFVPHEANNFRPHFLRIESAIIILCIIVLIELISLAQPFLISLNKNYFLSAVLPGVLVSLTNEQRAQNSLGSLKTNTQLTIAANLKAQDMAQKSYFAHVTPEGHNPWYWLEKAGYQYGYAGENLAVNFFESEDVAKAWMASPTHRENIVNPNYQEIGIGLASGIYEGKQTVFVVQFFGTEAPVSKRIVAAWATSTLAAGATAKAAVAPTVSTSTIPIKVLGAEINSPAVINVSVQGEKNVALMEFVKTAAASPRSGVFYLLIALSLAIFAAMLFVYFSRSPVLHRDLILTGFMLILVISIFMAFNENKFTESVKLPADNFGAATTSVSAVQ